MGEQPRSDGGLSGAGAGDPGARAAPSQPTGASVAERLRQIDQLLKERLTTQDEYNVRRQKILDAL